MTSHRFDHDFTLTAKQKATFLRDGVVKLDGILNPEAVSALLERLDAEMAAGAMPDRFAKRPASARMKYEFVYERDDVYSLLERPYFQHALTELVGRDLFLTFEQGFVLDRGVHTGVDWHVGTQTFGYQPTDEFACTLWCPLTPIDPKGQRGGLVYVPEHILSGRFVYEYVEPGIVSMLEGKERAGIATTTEEYFTLRVTTFKTPSLSGILEHHQIELDFQPGDALLFNKMVPHRSMPFGDGPLPQRSAFVLRFVETTSHYDLKRAQLLEFPARTYPSYQPVVRHHIEIAEAGGNDGDLLVDCEYFDNPGRRTLRRAEELAP